MNANVDHARHHLTGAVIIVIISPHQRQPRNSGGKNKENPWLRERLQTPKRLAWGELGRVMIPNGKVAKLSGM